MSEKFLMRADKVHDQLQGLSNCSGQPGYGRAMTVWDA
ncbi:hypothetical protein X749_19990 [Mesorhizobium sp. LNJC391B00]|nr:hypothetical protein X749_19990 [Mesorhizobium sp. LNJC391B00]